MQSVDERLPASIEIHNARVEGLLQLLDCGSGAHEVRRVCVSREAERRKNKVLDLVMRERQIQPLAHADCP